MTHFCLYILLPYRKHMFLLTHTHIYKIHNAHYKHIIYTHTQIAPILFSKLKTCVNITVNWWNNELFKYLKMCCLTEQCEAGSSEPQLDFLPSPRQSCSPSISVGSAAMESTNTEEKILCTEHRQIFFSLNLLRVQSTNHSHSVSFVMGTVIILGREDVHRWHGDLCHLYKEWERVLTGILRDLQPVLHGDGGMTALPPLLLLPPYVENESWEENTRIRAVSLFHLFKLLSQPLSLHVHVALSRELKLPCQYTHIYDCVDTIWYIPYPSTYYWGNLLAFILPFQT